MKRRASGVLGIFSHLDLVVKTILRLKEEGHQDLRVSSPAPFHEIEEVLESRVSPVRFFALIGGILGALSGFALTIGTSVSWPLITGGKPIISIPPFLIIVFELTILFGGVGTLIGVFLNAKLPKISLDTTYDPRFSEDLFGVFVSCPKEKFHSIAEILKSSGAEEVRFEED